MTCFVQKSQRPTYLGPILMTTEYAYIPTLYYSGRYFTCLSGSNFATNVAMLSKQTHDVFGRGQSFTKASHCTTRTR